MPVDEQPMNSSHAEKGQPLQINTSKSEKFIFLLYRIKKTKGGCGYLKNRNFEAATGRHRYVCVRLCKIVYNEAKMLWFQIFY